MLFGKISYYSLSELVFPQNGIFCAIEKGSEDAALKHFYDLCGSMRIKR